MSAKLEICSVDDGLKAKLRKFRFRKEKNVAAIVLKIDPERKLVIEDESYDDLADIDELVNDLPGHLPRYVVLSYVKKHDDGRVSYPFIFVFISPAGTKPELQMLYAGSKLSLVKEIDVTKVFELRDVEEFTEEWLKEKLALFN